MKILAFAEQRENKFRKTAFEVVTAAKKLAESSGAEVVCVVLGDRVKSIAPSLGVYGAGRIIVVEDPKLSQYSTTAYAAIVAEVAKKEGADVVLFPATALGKDLAPRVAVKLDAGLAADCTALRWENSELLATRPIFAGKIMTDVRISSKYKVFTLRPNVFTAVAGSGGVATVEGYTPQIGDGEYGTRVREIAQSSGKIDVAEADIIVSGGRGLKGPEHFKLIEELAAVLGAAVGASRAVVDAGWRPHDEQVGQTGKTVSPTLYIAVGISGAIQHLAGMSSSKYIVAINKDKDAPIFQVADYGIVGDAFEILPALTQEARKLLGK
ncbi:MAG: electron transfer flavoprotein subunit alpha/FixB family protein [Bacteroidota bacterium]